VGGDRNTPDILHQHIQSAVAQPIHIGDVADSYFIFFDVVDSYLT
jgi:hypothetical protein